MHDPVTVAAYRLHGADRIVAEVNAGGDMVQATLRTVDPHVSFKAVHASRGKVIRAEPVAALYEQRKVHHVGTFATLEDQLCAFTSDFDRSRAGYSPDRLDALVWTLTDLMLQRHVKQPSFVSPFIWSKTSGIISDPCPTLGAERSTTQKFYDYGGYGGGSAWPGSGPRDW